MEQGESHYLPSEVEAIARLALGPLPVSVASGDWWAYTPERNQITYPRLLLEAWSEPKVIGALFHEVAEAIYTGQRAIEVFARFRRLAADRGCDESSAQLLLNAVNDLRVNRLYLDRFPGSQRYFRVVYSEPSRLDRNVGAHSEIPPQNQFVMELTRRWIRSVWPEVDSWREPDGEVAVAVDEAWPAIRQAFEMRSLNELSEMVLNGVLPAYSRLLAHTTADRKDSSRRVPVESASDQTDRDESGQTPTVLEPGAWDEVTQGDREEAETSLKADVIVLPPPVDVLTSNDRAGKAPERSPSPGTNRWQRGSRMRGWSASAVYRARQRVREIVDYEHFDYVGAVRRLEPQIRATLDGREGQPGLAEILNMRRFGTVDPWRRPRRWLRAEAGDLDCDHPENLLINPAVAFLRGARHRREDSQKDFANVIVLDISGSVVQYGYPGRKFSQLVDTLVVFCELHERLKLPYELIAFSDAQTVLRTFQECRYASLHVDPSSTYVIRDYGHLVRRLYQFEHGQTSESTALRQALADAVGQSGLKTVMIVTDGISSDRLALTDLLVEIEQRNMALPAAERLHVLAFGLGLAKDEFKASYEPVVEWGPVRCSTGRLVPSITALPSITCQAIEARIREASGLAAGAGL